MISSFQKIYNKHSFTKLGELNYQMALGPCNAERTIIINSLQKIIKSLNVHGISTFPDFCQTFKSSGMSCKYIADFMVGFVERMKIKEIRTRLIKKSNSSEKNMIFTWICIHYSDQLINYFDEFVSTNQLLLSKEKMNIKNEIKYKIDQIHQQIHIRTLNANILSSSSEENKIIPKFYQVTKIKPTCSFKRHVIQLDNVLYI